MRLQPLAVSASAEKSLDLQLQLRVVVASKAEKHRLQKLLRLPLLLLLVFSASMAEHRLRLELSCVSWVPAWRGNALEKSEKATDDDPMVGCMQHSACGCHCCETIVMWMGPDPPM